MPLEPASLLGCDLEPHFKVFFNLLEPQICSFLAAPEWPSLVKNEHFKIPNAPIWAPGLQASLGISFETPNPQFGLQAYGPP